MGAFSLHHMPNSVFLHGIKAIVHSSLQLKVEKAELRAGLGLDRKAEALACLLVLS
jgi:hypothetical protein